MPTPIRLDTLTSLLDRYPRKDFILEGFTFGFSLQFEGTRGGFTSSNSTSVLKNMSVVLEKVNSEIKLGRIAGPFFRIPFPQLKCTPLSLREKSTPGSYRLLHNLSYPYDHTAVNFGIPEESKSVRYASLNDAIKVLQTRPGAYMAKADIKDAFRLIPLAPMDYELTGFTLQAKFYYDRCLPMGASSACNIFEKFSDALVFILKDTFRVKHIVKVLDDFLFIGDTEGECADALESFLAIAKLIRLPLAAHKTVRPTTCLEFLGVQIDSANRMTALPLNKVSKYRDEVTELLKLRHTTLNKFKSVIGKLSFATCIMPAGRCFIRRMHDATRHLSSSSDQVKITQGIKEDLRVWLSFLSNFNGKIYYSSALPLTSCHLNFFSDSSLVGYGATFRSHFIHGSFPSSWASLGIQFLELYPIFLMMNIFAPSLANTCFTFYCDNLAIVHILNKLTTPVKHLMVLVRDMVHLMLKHNISFSAKHIPGQINTTCDHLSRQLPSRQFLRDHRLDPSPTPIPAHLLPHNFRLQSTA